jgi:hypothetical protein
MDQFKKALEFCSLFDLGFEGDVFTWRNNNHICENYIRERLDRIVVNVERRTRFLGLRVINGEHRHSNHRLMVVVMEDGNDSQGIRGPYMFRFMAGWVKEGCVR